MHSANPFIPIIPIYCYGEELICHGCGKDIPDNSRSCPYCHTVFDAGNVPNARQSSYIPYPTPKSQPQEEEYVEVPAHRKPFFVIGLIVVIIIGMLLLVAVILIFVTLIFAATPLEDTSSNVALKLSAQDAVPTAAQDGNASSFEYGEQVVLLTQTGGESINWGLYKIWMKTPNGVKNVEATVLTIAGVGYRAGLQSGDGDPIILGIKDPKDNGVLKANDNLIVEVQLNAKPVFISSSFTVK